MERLARALILQVEGHLQVRCLRRGDVDDASQGHGVEDGLRGGLQHLQPVKGLEQRVARHCDAVVLRQNGRAGRGKGLRQHPGIIIELSEGNPLKVPQQDIALGNGAGVEDRIGDGKGHDMDRMGLQHRPNLRMGLIDRPVERHGPGGELPRLPLRPPHQHQVLRLQIGPVPAKGRDQEAAVGQPDRIGAVGGGKHAAGQVPDGFQGLPYDGRGSKEKAVGKGASETIKFSKNLEVSDTIPRPVEQLTQTESPNLETFA